MAEEKKDGRAHNDGSKSLAPGDGGITTLKPDDGLAPGPSDVGELQEKFPTAKTVSVKRYTADRRWESLGSVPMDILDDDLMVNEFGPGLYTLYLRDHLGKILGGTPTIRIGERASRGKAFSVTGAGGVTESAPASYPPISRPSAAEQQLELLKSELQRRDEMIYRMLDALAQRTAPAAAPTTAAAPSLVELLTAFEKFQKLQPAAAPVSFSEKLLERAFNMATKGGKNSEGSDWYDFLKDIWAEVKGPLMQLAAPAAVSVLQPPPIGLSPLPADPAAAAAPIAAAAPVTPAETVRPPSVSAAAEPAGDAAEDDLETVTVDIDPWITDLKEQCRAGRPAELVAGFVKTLCDRNEDVAAVTEQLITGDFEEFLKLDPELTKQPAFKPWFEKLFEVLRVQLLGSAGNSSGAGRNGTNA